MVSLMTLAGYGGLAFIVFQQRDRVAVLDEALAFEKGKEERLRSLQGLLEEVAQGRETIDAQFLLSDEDAVVAYIRTLESLNTYVDSEIDVLSVELVGTPKEDDRAIQVRLSVVGTRENMITFVKLLEYLPTVTLIDSVNLTARDTNLWNASFVLFALVSE